MRIVVVMLFTLAAFAANNLLCRKALAQTSIDPASFTLVRMASGAIMLLMLTRLKRGVVAGNWRAASALFVYMVCFSFAYVRLVAGTGALLLFGAVQTTMIPMGPYLWRAPGRCSMVWPRHGDCWTCGACRTGSSRARTTQCTLDGRLWGCVGLLLAAWPF